MSTSIDVNESHPLPPVAPPDWAFGPAVRVPATSPPRSLRIPPSRAIWVLAAGGVGCWIASEGGLSGLAGTLYAVLTVVAMLTCGVFAEGRRQPVVLTLGAGVFGVFLVIRDSPWLSALNICALIVLLVVAALVAAEGSIFDASRSFVADRLSAVLESYWRAFPLATSLMKKLVSKRRQAPKSGRKVSYKGLFLASPLVLCLIPLLMSSDAVFSRLFSVPASLFGNIPVPSGGGLFAIGTGTYLAAVLLAITVTGSPIGSGEPTGFASQQERVFATKDVVTAFWAVNAVLGAFALSQIIAATNLAAKLVTEPPTYEAIAKRGFFPLLVASALILGSFVVSHSLLTEEGRSSRSFLIPAQLLVVLSVVLVSVASRRLYMGARVWGLTMLRVMSQTFAIWLVVIFVLIGVWQQRRSSKSWLLGAALVVASTLLVVLNVAPTEGLVGRWNISSGFAPKSDAPSQASSQASWQSRGGSGLSSCPYYGDKWHGRNDDARPTLLPWIRTEVKLKRATNDCARDLLGCDSARSSNGLRWNLSRSQGARLRSKACREFPSAVTQVAPPS